MQKNWSGERIPPLADFLSSGYFADFLSGQLCRILVSRAGITRQKATDIARDIFSIIRHRKTQQDAAHAATALLAAAPLVPSASEPTLGETSLPSVRVLAAADKRAAQPRPNQNANAHPFDPRSANLARSQATAWLTRNQNADGGWGAGS